MLDRRRPLQLVLNEVGEDTILVIPNIGYRQGVVVEIDEEVSGWKNRA